MKHKCEGIFCENEAEGDDRYCEQCGTAMMLVMFPWIEDDDESLG